MEEVAETGGGEGERRPPDLRVCESSAWAACPLRGRGEARAEHLVVWCPAVSLAAREWMGEGRTLLSWLRQPPADPEMVTRLIHQASFLNCSLRGQSAMQWPQSARWIMRACVAYRPEVCNAEDDERSAGEEDAGDVEMQTWDTRAPEGCE